MLRERNSSMNISIRKFEKKDISNKVKWINDPLNNTYLHYDLPLSEEKTEKWFDNNKDRIDRYDAIIEADGVSVGLIGLIGIDSKNKKAEYYVTIGDRNYLGKGIAKKASLILLEYAFKTLELERVYLYTEIDNISAVKLYEKIGFKKEGIIKKDVFSKGRYVDRYVFGLTKNDFYKVFETPILHLNDNLYVKREDYIPFSFGGNKARKAQLFFEEIDNGSYDCVVTYGSSSSNHCRVVANMASSRGMKCFIISPEEASEKTYNSKMMNVFGAEITICPVDQVHDTIEKLLQSLKDSGYTPYFIAGGGHGNIGTQAYVNCYEEIRNYERANNIHFDYIFHASGTGTTQAGLVCGQLINRDERTIVGISIARKSPRGRNVVLDSIKEYLLENKINVSDAEIENATVFDDSYIFDGYGAHPKEVDDCILDALKKYGLPLDSTYTGKAFYGMLNYVNKNEIQGKKILFIHTGGTPLFFDYLNEVGE